MYVLDLRTPRAAAPRDAVRTRGLVELVFTCVVTAWVTLAERQAAMKIGGGRENVEAATRRLNMRKLGRRAVMVHKMSQQENEGAARVFTVGKAAAHLHAVHSFRRPQKRSRIRQFCRHLLFGEESASARAQSYREGHGAEHAQTPLERTATRLIEGIHKEGSASFSEDHELAVTTDGVLCDLVIKREAALDDLSLRIVAKHDIFSGGFYMLFFLVFFWVVVDQMKIRDRYELEGAMLGSAVVWNTDGKELHVSDIGDMDDVWDWLQGTLVPYVFPDEQWYNGDPYTDDEKGYLLHYNQLVGGFQIVQKRIAPNHGCEKSRLFGDWAGDCFPAYDDDLRLEEPFGPAHDPDKYTFWRDPTAVTDTWAGYHVQFPLDRKLAYRTLAELKDDKFLTRQTRELRVDLTVYNHNKRLFCSVCYVLEFFETGMIKAHVEVGSIQIENYDHISARLICEILVVIKVVQQLFDEVKEVWAYGLIRHIKSIWNWVDALRIGFFSTCIGCYIKMQLDPVSQNLTLPLPPDQIFVDFSNLNVLTQTYVRRASVAILLCLMSVLKYMRHSQTYGTLAITLTYAGPEIMRFLLMFSLVNMTFVIMGLLMFGNALEEFSTITRSSQTLLMMMTGEYGYSALSEVNETSAVTFYSFYLILVFFILVNMFLAVVFDAYATLQESREHSASFPYRFSYIQEELLELRRYYAEKYPRLFKDYHPQQFFLTTEEMHALLSDPIKLGSNSIGETRDVVNQEDSRLSHVVHANVEQETVITKDDMLDLGWPEQHIRWLLSQIGVPDDTDDNDFNNGRPTWRQSARRSRKSLPLTQRDSMYRRVTVNLSQASTDVLSEDLPSVQAAAPATAHVSAQHASKYNNGEKGIKPAWLDRQPLPTVNEALHSTSTTRCDSQGSAEEDTIAQVRAVREIGMLRNDCRTMQTRLDETEKFTHTLTDTIEGMRQQMAEIHAVVMSASTHGPTDMSRPGSTVPV